jgi:hypothetical protein
MPFSKAYHMTQSSALTLLYAATTFLQHASGLSDGADDDDALATAACDDVGLEAAGVFPPHATARTPMIARIVASLCRMFPPA